MLLALELEIRKQATSHRVRIAERCIDTADRAFGNTLLLSVPFVETFLAKKFVTFLALLGHPNYVQTNQTLDLFQNGPSAIVLAILRV